MIFKCPNCEYVFNNYDADYSDYAYEGHWECPQCLEWHDYEDYIKMNMKCSNCDHIFNIDDAEDYWDIYTGYYYKCPKCNHSGELDDYEKVEVM